MILIIQHYRKGKNRETVKRSLFPGLEEGGMTGWIAGFLQQ
jgi:hypothetical protein